MRSSAKIQNGYVRKRTTSNDIVAMRKQFLRRQESSSEPYATVFRSGPLAARICLSRIIRTESDRPLLLTSAETEEKLNAMADSYVRPFAELQNLSFLYTG